MYAIVTDISFTHLAYAIYKSSILAYDCSKSHRHASHNVK